MNMGLFSGYNYPASQAALEQAVRDKRRRERKVDPED